MLRVLAQRANTLRAAAATASTASQANALAASAPSSSRGLATLPPISDNDAVIVSGVRTPIGAFNGGLASLSATDMGAAVVEEAVSRAGVSPDSVDECFMGQVLQANAGQAPARQAALRGGLPLSVPCTTVHKVCASGMKTVMLAAQSIRLGENSVVVAGGMESMSQTPYYLPKARWGAKYGDFEVIDGIRRDGLSGADDNEPMGMCGEACADEYSISREEADAFAAESYQRAAEATEKGLLKDEIMEMTVKQGRKEMTISEDEEYKRGDPSKFGSLRPAFKKDGIITAANASSINDGAVAMVLMSAAEARAQKLQPLARIRGYADAALAPIQFPVAPAFALPKALERAGIHASDVDFWEINEAFSVVGIANMRLLDIARDRLNVNGGAVALGHPIGASGARIVNTLINVLRQNDATIGAAGICNGGGGASAIVIERLS